ncbi:MAG: aspartate kinase, partial [Oscillospiraceae bacterium]|nr:aspartate kinase [Oscillospiraceae bacterium]
MLKVCKFGGSSVAGAEQFRKVRDIVLSDESRRVVVISAAGKRFGDDHKLTDLLYLIHAHLTYGVSCDEILKTVEDRLTAIRDELDIPVDIAAELAAFHRRLSKDTSADEIVSRGEYFTARLMAAFLGYAFVDAADCVFFGLDGGLDRETTDAAIAEVTYDELRELSYSGAQ